MLNKGIHLEKLFDYKNGKIKQGLGIGTKLDDYLRYKPRQLNIILGHDNVGKTYWINWYFLTLALKHELKFVMWSGENQYWQILRDMVQIYSGKAFKQLSERQISSYMAYLEQYFEFIDNSKLYKPNELFELFRKSDADACLIDPYTGLDRQMGYEGNYKFLNDARQFCNETGKTLYINTHPNTESGRSGNIYPDNHIWKGHLKPPLKDHIEGGKAFLNRCDDMIVIHRLVKHETMKYVTLVTTEKIKDQETGGAITGFEDFILCEFNHGLGFIVENKDPLKEIRPRERQTKLQENELMNTSEKLRRLANETPF
jgi:hypothetical protein